MIRVVIPVAIQRLVNEKYVELYTQMKMATGSTYPRRKLIDNIRNVLSINGGYIEPSQLKEPTINNWKNIGNKVLQYNNWYYGVVLRQYQDIIVC